MKSSPTLLHHADPIVRTTYRSHLAMYALAAQFVQGLAFSGSVLIWWLGVNYFARSREVGLYMAIHQTLTGVRGVVTPLIGIWIARRVGYRQSMLFWLGLMLIGTAIMIAEVIREKRRSGLGTFSEKEAALDDTGPTAQNAGRKIG